MDALREIFRERRQCGETCPDLLFQSRKVGRDHLEDFCEASGGDLVVESADAVVGPFQEVQIFGDERLDAAIVA